MPAITSLVFAASTRGFTSLAGSVRRCLAQLSRLRRHRREFAYLAELNDRELRDIGLTRGDLLTANDEPLWRDPTEVLARRIAEGRIGRRVSDLRAACRHNGKSDPSIQRQPLARSSRHLV